MSFERRSASITAAPQAVDRDARVAHIGTSSVDGSTIRISGGASRYAVVVREFAETAWSSRQ
jgi:hypothetical protein